MTQKITGTMDPDFLAIAAALRRAAKRALREGLETGTPVWVIKNGRMLDLTRGKRRKARKPRAR
ncbi:MAG: hypothetical protein WBD75_08380 [Phycisphaerae bacterium]